MNIVNVVSVFLCDLMCLCGVCDVDRHEHEHDHDDNDNDDSFNIVCSKN